jgi:cold shock CspA family protein
VINGTIDQLDPRGFGFVNGDDGVRRFFQAKEVRGYPFDSLTIGQRVTFKHGTRLGKGPRAFNVELITTSARAAA